MSTETVVHYFTSRVRQETDESPFDYNLPKAVFRLQLTFYKLFGSCRIEAPRNITRDRLEIIADKQLPFSRSDFLLPSKRDTYTKYLANFLSSEMRVPKDEQPLFIEKIFQAVEVANFPGPRIVGVIVDCTVRVFGDIQVINNRRAKLTPATKSSIEGLEKVRLDSLEASFKKMPCAICKEGLDHFDDDGGVEQGFDDNHQPMIARLPCLHLYHKACIVQWLDKCHLCPLCRYPMPNMVEEGVGEPSNTSRRLHWPVVLAGGIITAMLLCRLLKQRQG